MKVIILNSGFGRINGKHYDVEQVIGSRSNDKNNGEWSIEVGAGSIVVGKFDSDGDFLISIHWLKEALKSHIVAW